MLGSVSLSAQQYQRLVSSTFGGTVTEFLTYRMDFNSQFLAASLKLLIGHKVKQMPKIWPLLKNRQSKSVKRLHWLFPKCPELFF